MLLIWAWILPQGLDVLTQLYLLFWVASILVQMIEDRLSQEAKKKPIVVKLWPNQTWKLLDQCIIQLLFFSFWFQQGMFKLLSGSMHCSNAPAGLLFSHLPVLHESEGNDSFVMSYFTMMKPWWNTIIKHCLFIHFSFIFILYIQHV